MVDAGSNSRFEREFLDTVRTRGRDQYAEARQAKPMPLPGQCDGPSAADTLRAHSRESPWLYSLREPVRLPA